MADREMKESLVRKVTHLHEQGYRFMVLTPFGDNDAIHINVTYKQLSLAVFKCNRRDEVVVTLGKGRNNAKFAFVVTIPA